MTSLPLAPHLVDERVAAAALGMSLEWIRKDRRGARIVPFYKIGSACRYSLDRCYAALAQLEHGGPKAGAAS